MGVFLFALNFTVNLYVSESMANVLKNGGSKIEQVLTEKGKHLQTRHFDEFDRQAEREGASIQLMNSRRPHRISRPPVTLNRLREMDCI